MPIAQDYMTQLLWARIRAAAAAAPVPARVSPAYLSGGEQQILQLMKIPRG